MLPPDDLDLEIVKISNVKSAMMSLLSERSELATEYDSIYSTIISACVGLANALCNSNIEYAQYLAAFSYVDGMLMASIVLIDFDAVLQIQIRCAPRLHFWIARMVPI